MCAAILLLDHPAWRSDSVREVPVTQRLAKTVGEPLGVEQVVELRGRMVEPTAGLEPATYGLRKRENSEIFEGVDAEIIAIDPVLERDDPVLRPDQIRSLPDVPATLLIDADFESNAWMLDAQFARTESAAACGAA